MSVSTAAASLRSLRSNRPSISPQSQDAVHGDDHETIGLEQLSRRLLQHESHEQNQGRTNGNEQREAHGGEAWPSSTALPGSSGSSVLSYDSLEESPIPDGDHMQSPTINTPGSKHKSRHYSCTPTTIWKLEILSCVIALLCLGAIVGILCMHQGLPLPQWPYEITLNALVSVFTAIFKMALMIPVAEGKQKHMTTDIVGDD